MSSLKEFRCEICGVVSQNPIHWFVIKCTDWKLAIIKWDLTAATSFQPHGISVAKPTLRFISAAGLNLCASRPNEVLKVV